MNGLVSKENLGSFRREASAIFNSAGIAVYIPPCPSQVIPLINKLLQFANSQQEQFIPIKATIIHYIFEKIHPFLDGNGRIGRLLIQAVLTKGGYSMKELLALEEEPGLWFLLIDRGECQPEDLPMYLRNVPPSSFLDTIKELFPKHSPE